MTKGNLRKRRILNRGDSCSQNESVHHVMFDCVVPNNIQPIISEIFEIKIGDSYESVVMFWVSSSQNSTLNSITNVVL